MPTIRINVFTCKRCGVSHNNPIKHVCVLPFSPSAFKRLKDKQAHSKTTR
ncbi:hypothetical protein OIE66_30655 [Nonomuraea sp. NBC_01738]|nr:hypothetical protein OIE66_30655 [Nonomuraea sp. NBC_01738]